MSNSRRLRPVRALHQAGQNQDVRYFQANPTKRAYMREATPMELRATGFPPGTQVYVALVGRDTRTRAFIPPDVRRN